VGSSFQFSVNRAALVVRWVRSITEYTFGWYFPGFHTLITKVIASAFDTPGRVIAISLGVSIILTPCTLRVDSFLVRLLDFDDCLEQTLQVKYFGRIIKWFQVNEK